MYTDISFVPRSCRGRCRRCCYSCSRPCHRHLHQNWLISKEPLQAPDEYRNWSLDLSSPTTELILMMSLSEGVVVSNEMMTWASGGCTGGMYNRFPMSSNSSCGWFVMSVWMPRCKNNEKDLEVFAAVSVGTRNSTSKPRGRKKDVSALFDVFSNNDREPTRRRRAYKYYVVPHMPRNRDNILWTKHTRTQKLRIESPNAQCSCV